MATTQSFNLQGQLNTDPGMVVSQVGNVLTVTAGAPPVVTGVTVSGAATVNEGATAQYTAQVSGTGNYNKGVIWSCSDGSISQTGLFTAPGKVEQVTITATSQADSTKFGTCPVSIANQSNTVTLAPSGGNDTAALQAALNKLTSGQVLQMLVGTWNLGPIEVPGVPLLFTPAINILDIPGYAETANMFTTTDGSQITGTGAFVSMPNSFAASMKDGSEYRHAFRMTGKNPTLTGVSISQAGGDGVYGIALTGGSLVGVSAKGCFRNGCSTTDGVNGFLVSGCNFGEQAGGDKVIQCAYDHEPNPTGAALPSVITIQNCQFLNNVGFPISNGLRLSLNNLNTNNPAVRITVNNNVANGNTINYHLVLPDSAGGKIPAGWSLVGSGNSFAFP